MALTPGTRLGAYEIAALLGAGGMGEVFRARDTKLNRDVALKVLPDSFAGDPDRLARFTREAQTLASLNHANIAHIHGLEESGGLRALVMELVEGEDLSQRIARGAIPVDEALPIAKQIAEALEAAHGQGIIHRDLKPANVKVRPDGTVKVLDFGLAKLADRPVPADVDVAQSPTRPLHATLGGVILGTPAYMSPEQARGKPVDKRADIWAFGCVVFEMLTGRTAFGRTGAADTLAAVLEHQPEWGMLPLRTPPRVERLLRRCLQKDRTRRLRDIGDALLDLDDAPEDDFAAAGPRISAGSRAAAAALFLVIGMIVGAALVWRVASAPARDPQQGVSGRFSIALGVSDALANLENPAVAISADGKRLAFVAGSTPRLFLRELDESQARPVPGSEGASAPFFSPDGRSVAFFADSRIKKVSVTGGDPVTVAGSAAAGNPRGGAWNVDGTIAFTPAPGTAIFGVNADGGTPQPLTKLDVARGEGAHHWPEFMPDGKAILYTVGTGTATSWDDREIVVESLSTGERHVVAHGTAARYVASGHLVVARGGALTTIPFDPTRLQTTGAPIRIAEGVMQSAFGAAQFSASRNGTFVYVAGGTSTRELVWFSRAGVAKTLPAPAQTYWSVRISPDGQRLALGVEAASYGVWLHDLARGTPTRLTFDGTSAFPIWTPDGARLTFNSTKSGGVLNLFWRPADGSGEDERLATSDAIQIANSWSPNGRVLAYQNNSPQTGRDIWLLSLDQRDTPWPFLQTKYEEGGAAFSPDGRWMAYVSTEAGPPNIYVVAMEWGRHPFPGPGEKVRVSSDGGGGPVWSRNGHELFYRNGNSMMVTDVESGSRLRVGNPRVLFEGRFGRTPFQADYDLSPDGQQFIMIQARGEQGPVTQLEIAINAVGTIGAAGPTMAAHMSLVSGMGAGHSGDVTRHRKTRCADDPCNVASVNRPEP